jgi:hypothetical protein
MYSQEKKSDSYLAVVRVEQQINRLGSTLFSQIGNTPLHLAVDGGHSEVVKQLLLFKVNVDIKSSISHVLCLEQIWWPAGWVGGWGILCS